MSFTEPNEGQKQIIQANGIRLDAVSVVHDAGDFIVLKHHKSGDSIIINQGDKKWTRL